MSGYPYSYHDPHYDAAYHRDEMNYLYDPGPSSAAGPSNYPSTDVYPTPKRKNTADGLPSRPAMLALRPHVNATNDRRALEASPPRKLVRVNADAAVPRRNASNRETSRRHGAGDGHNRERTSSNSQKRLPRLNVDPAVQSFVDALQLQQDVNQDRIGIEANNAKFLKYKDRDDISRENKLKAERALDETNEAKREVKLAWRAVGDKLNAVMNLVLEHQAATMPAQENRSTDSKMTRSRESQTRPITPPRPRAAAAPALATSNDDNEREPGEISPPEEVHTRGAPGTFPLPQSVAAASKPSDANAAKEERKKVIQAVTRTSILERFDDINSKLAEIKVDTEERLSQFETTIEDLVRLEVADRIKKAKEANIQDRKNSQITRAQGEATVARPVVSAAAATSSNTTTSAARGAVGAEEGELRNALSRSSPPQYSPLGRNAPTTANSDNGGQLSPHIRKDIVEPCMFKEQVGALMESMRQAIRQEYDTKLFEQEKRNEAKLIELRTQVANKLKEVAQTQNKQMEILSNHHQNINRHDQVMASALSLFSNVPRPTI